MKAIQQERRTYFRVLIITTGAMILALSAMSGGIQVAQFWPMVGAIVLVAFLVNFPLNIFLSELTPIFMITLGAALILGVPTAVWVTAIGAFIGLGLQNVFQVNSIKLKSHGYEWWIDLGFEIGFNLSAITIAFAFFGYLEFPIITLPSDRVWIAALTPSLAFALLHSFFFWLDKYLLWGIKVMSNFGDILLLVVIELLPIPLVLVGLEAYSFIGTRLVLILAFVPVIIAVLLYGVTVTRADMQKRVLELSSLSNVSQALRASLDLDNLLPIIQEQVMRVIQVNNFYVALLDDQRQRIWYPLAVKNGERQNWPPRPIAERLTDRVIKENDAIIFTPQIQSGPNPVGVPKGELMPKSWLGVPLITTHRTIGCLAVFEIFAEVEFSDFDVDLLVTLSNQVSIAIENALLYEQSQYRATQLESLNRLTSQITASLELEEVVAQVTQAVSQVSEGGKSAIYLYNPGDDVIKLAHAHNLSAGFTLANKEFSIGQGRRTRCLRTGDVVLNSDVSNSTLPEELLLAFRLDGIQAFADFPLITPEGQIGFLTAFYNAIHDFPAEEVKLLQTFAAQAALAVANAQLHATTDAQLTRRVHQLAILEAVGREISAATHSDRLFQLVLDFVIEFTGVSLGAIILFDPESNLAHIKAKHGYDLPDEMAIEKGITIKALREGQIQNIGDVRLDEDYLDVVNGKTLSQLSVPISHEDNILGIITLESEQLNAFSKHEQSLVEQLANQAAVALENANLFRETQRHLREQSTLSQVAARFVGARDASTALDDLGQALIAVVMPSQLGIYIWDELLRVYVKQSVGIGGKGERLPKTVAEQEAHALPFGINRSDDLTRDSGSQVLSAVQDDSLQTLYFDMRTARGMLGFVIIECDCENEIDLSLFKLLDTIVSQGTIAVQNALLFSETAQRREELTALINSVTESILMIDRDGLISLSNQPLDNLSGLSRVHLLGTKLGDLSEHALNRLGFAPQEITSFLEQLPIEKESSYYPKEVYQVPEFTPETTMERTAYPVSGLAEHARGWMIIWRDVSEEQKVNREREAIADALIHDLRSPMSAVLGALDLLDDVIPQEQQGELVDRSLKVARRGAKRVMRLIMSLLDVARMQSGRIELNKSTVNLKELVPELLMDIEVISDEYNIQVESEFPDKLSDIIVDEDKISRVITNLLDNAVKFSEENSTVRVLVSQDNGFVTVQVWDHGPGISDENRAIIFERFSQISGQFGRWKGAGLGLAFCRLAVEAHGGRIWVEDPPKGKGSIFAFTVPVK